MYPRITKFFKKQANSINNIERQNDLGNTLSLTSSSSQLNVSPNDSEASKTFLSPSDMICSQYLQHASSASTSPSSPPLSSLSKLNLSPSGTAANKAFLSSLNTTNSEEVQFISSSSISQTSPASTTLSSFSKLNLSSIGVITTETSLSSQYDAGLYIGKILSDEEKYQLLMNHFQPDKTFKWPFKERISIINGKKSVENRYLKQNHLDEFKRLRYSPSQNGLYCIACAIFTTSTSRISYGRLVEKPLDDYKYLLGNNGELVLHQQKQYHLDCITKMENFIYIYSKKPETSINLLMNKRLQNEIEENRARLRPIVETILLCGKQNLSLRGHRGDGNSINDNDISIIQERNFRALLQYRIQGGDTILKHHFETCGKNATYISKTIQNELISIIGNIILKQVIQEVKQAQFFTILLDETCDIANIEQASLCIRYILNDQIQRLDLQYCVGQGYDGCGAMAGCIIGFQALIREQYPHILYVHCASHNFYLVLSDSCSIRSIQNKIDTIKEIYNFIRSSSVRTQLFEDLARQLNDRKQIVTNDNLPL